MQLILEIHRCPITLYKWPAYGYKDGDIIHWLAKDKGRWYYSKEDLVKDKGRLAWEYYPLRKKYALIQKIITEIKEIKQYL